MTRPSSRKGRNWDMDADAFDHRNTNVPYLEVTPRQEKTADLYGPDGRVLKRVRPERPAFGFRPKAES